MAEITFFTKPGCMTGEKQLALLRCSGHQVTVHSLLSHDWTKDELVSYFGESPVREWFNPNSPRVKSGEVAPEAHTAEEALAAMLQDHLLIRRPLMESGGKRVCGFNVDKLKTWIGLAEPEPAADFQSCSQPVNVNGTAFCPDGSGRDKQ